jgi:hypothetical protein
MDDMSLPSNACARKLRTDGSMPSVSAFIHIPETDSREGIFFAMALFETWADALKVTTVNAKSKAALRVI